MNLRPSFLAFFVLACAGRADLGGAYELASGGTSSTPGSGGASGNAGATSSAGASANGGAGGIGPDSGGGSSAGGTSSSGGGRDAGAGLGGAQGGGSDTGGSPGTGGATENGGATASAGGVSSGGVASGGSPSDGGPHGDAALCDDNVQDGTESDVDCGGACRPCAFDQKCVSDTDCSKTAPGCDPSLGGCACDLSTHRCAASHCTDERRDSTESDVDCGGTCTLCGLGKRCNSDGDCSYLDPSCGQSGCYCDALSSTCVYSHCVDHKMDVYETDVDCGGTCVGCALGQPCWLDWDCASLSCQATTFICTADACQNGHQDNAETDTDCGGGTCAACGPGMTCKVTSDCQSGYTCTKTTPHLCQ